MKSFFYSKFKIIYRLLLHFFGLNLRVFTSIYFFPKYIKDIFKFKYQKGKINKYFPILHDLKQAAGNVKGHYFQQDIYVANLIFKDSPNNHLDIGSRIDGFISVLSVFMKVHVMDIRKINLNIKNINFIQGDITSEDFDIQSRYSSISCLHSIEHFGLGRYGDKIDPMGHINGFKNLYNLMDIDSKLYISFPISSNPRVEFNEQRVFSFNEIFKWIKLLKINDLKLVLFSYIDDDSTLHKNVNLFTLDKLINYGCGIYIFKKIKH